MAKPAPASAASSLSKKTVASAEDPGEAHHLRMEIEQHGAVDVRRDQVGTGDEECSRRRREQAAGGEEEGNRRPRHDRRLSYEEHLHRGMDAVEGGVEQQRRLHVLAEEVVLDE